MKVGHVETVKHILAAMRDAKMEIPDKRCSKACATARIIWSEN